MRFCELELVRYARFENCRLNFRQGTPDFHIVFGPNEAGKSTTLAAISDLLFGFPARTDYAFRFDMPLLRVGAVLEEDGRRFAFRRKKGNKGTVLSADDRPIDEQPLIAMLHGQERNLYRLGWSLDHHRLREGGKAIVDASDDLGRALFAAGSGLTGIAEVLSAINKEADAIWGARASDKRAYSRAERTYTDSARQLRDAQLRPTEWKNARTDLETIESSLSEQECLHSEQLKTQRQLERLRRVLAPVRQHEELRKVLHEMQTVLLPQGLEADAANALAEAGEAERMRAIAAGMLEERQHALSQLRIDLAVLGAREEIDALPGAHGAVQKGSNDLARLNVRLEASRGRITAIRTDLGLGDGAEPGATPLPSRLIIEELRGLSAERVKIETALNGLQATVTQWQQRRERFSGELSELIPPPQLDGLAAAVSAAERLGDIEETCERQTTAAARVQRESEIAFERLQPWSGKGETLARLILPDNDAIDIARATIERANAEEEQAGRDAAGFAQEREQLTLQVHELAEVGQAVSAEALASAREDRDADWQTLKTRIVAPQPVSESEMAPFESAMQKTDTLADLRFALAKDSAQLSQIEAQQRQLALKIDQAGKRCEAAARAKAAACATWQKQLSARGLPTIAAAEFRDWAQRRQIALEWTEATRQAEAEAANSTKRRDEAGTALKAALGGDVSAEEKKTLTALMDEARRRVKAGDALRAQINDLTRKLSDAGEQLQAARQDLAAQEAQVSPWRLRWDQAMAQTGLVFSPEASEARLSLLEELRNETTGVSELQHRIDAIIGDTTSFEVRVTELAQRMNEDIQGRHTDELLDVLRRRLESAKAAASRQADLQREAKSHASALREAETRLQATDAALADLRQLTGAKDRITAAEALEASRSRRAMENSMRELEAQIAGLSDGVALDDLVGPCHEADPDTLADQVKAAQERINALESEIRQTSSRQALAKQNFESMNSGQLAIEASASMQEARAEMAAQAEIYLLRRTQYLMLRWAMERYRERQQNPLLARATELFRTLTCGRYHDLRIDYDSPSPRLLGLSEDGESAVGVEAMSDGTVDQLYLALRIAAIEQALRSGVRMPFLADDLFINFDNDRARAGFQLLADLARSTQVLFFTHHSHLVDLARDVMGTDRISVCDLT